MHLPIGPRSQHNHDACSTTKAQRNQPLTHPDKVYIPAVGPYSSARVTSKGTTAPRHHRTFQGPSLPRALTHSRARVTNKEATAPRHNKASRLRDNNRCAPPPRVGTRPRRWRQTVSSPHRGKVVADRVGSGQHKWKATRKGLITAPRIFEDVLF